MSARVILFPGYNGFVATVGGTQMATEFRVIVERDSEDYYIE